MTTVNSLTGAAASCRTFCLFNRSTASVACLVASFASFIALTANLFAAKIKWSGVSLNVSTEIPAAPPTSPSAQLRSFRKVALRAWFVLGPPQVWSGPAVPYMTTFSADQNSALAMPCAPAHQQRYSYYPRIGAGRFRDASRGN